MNLGLAIFLSAVFLGTVALYIATMDRWNWKKITIRTLLGILGLLVLGVGGILLWELWVDVGRSPRTTARPDEVIPTQFDPSRYGATLVPSVGTVVTDVPLGSSKADVRFLNGEPWEAPAMLVKFPDRWRYVMAGDPVDIHMKDGTVSPGRSIDDPSVLIYFSEERVHAVVCVHKEDEELSGELRGTLLRQTGRQTPSPYPCGAAIGWDSEELTTSYGEPSEIRRSKDDLTRVYLFPERKEMYGLEKNRVVLTGIYDPSVEGPSDFRDGDVEIPF